MNRPYGFTLIELMITLAIAAIVMAIGVPSFQVMMRTNRIAAHTNDFLGSLNLARSEAIKRGAGSRVVLCPGTQAGCSGSAWGSGWIVFVDANDNGVWDAGEQLLRVHEKLSGDDALTGDTLVRTYISFASDGVARLAGNNAVFQLGTLTFTMCNSSNQRNRIEIGQTGRARVVPVPASCP